MLFLKPSTSVIGDGDYIRLPPDTNLVHHEAELAAVIGRPARDVSPRTRSSHVFGYTAANDVSARDQQARRWPVGPGQGPRLVLPARAVDRDRARPVRSAHHHAGQRRAAAGRPDQPDDPRLPQLIAYMSAVMTLLPGDVILTGTPAGVGPIIAGDVVTVEIEGIGALTEPGAATSESARRH